MKWQEIREQLIVLFPNKYIKAVDTMYQNLLLSANTKLRYAETSFRGQVCRQPKKVENHSFKAAR